MRRLIIRPGAIGDCILALPAIEFLSTPDTEVWAPSAVLPLLRGVARARSIASTGLDLIGLPGVDPPQHLLAALRSFDSIMSWYGENREEFREAVRDYPFEFLRALPAPDNRLHCADFFAQQVGAPTPAIPRIAVNPEPGNYAVIHPFSGSKRKNWPLDRYRELAAMLPMPVRWCAGPEEELPDAVRFDNLYDLACWIAGARVYIGNDSGITHLAAAAGAPVVAIFGPTDPAIWGPRGANVRIVQGELENVYNAVRCLL
jgi:ADP-heptose:LPS heptosyltransferase